MRRVRVPLEDNVTGLADAIDALRLELAAAITRGEGADVKFLVDPVELTVQAVVTKGVDGRIGWGVIGIGGKREAATTQILRLQLKPLFKTKDGRYVEDFAVSGQRSSRPQFGGKQSNVEPPRPENRQD
jgi:hypothetical protein